MADLRNVKPVSELPFAESAADDDRLILTDTSNAGRTVQITKANLLAGVSGEVTLAGAETLTNKTISAADNILTGVATLTGTEVLTNKTIDASLNTLLNLPGGGNVTLLSSVDALVGLVPGSASLAQVLGRGGGLFRYSTTQLKSTHNGATIISPTVPLTGTAAQYLDGVGETDPSGTGAWVREFDGKTFRSEWFRTVANGVADDAPQLQRAITAAAGRRLEIEGAHHIIDAQLNVTADATQIILEPQCHVEAKIISTGVGRTFFFSNCNNWGLEGFGAKVSAPRDVAGSNGLYVNSCDNWVIEGIEFDGSRKDCIYLGNGGNGPSKNGTIRKCEIYNGRRQGISIIHAEGTLIEDCVIHDIAGDSPSAAIDIEGNAGDIVRNTTISNCKFYNMNDQGAVLITLGWNTIIQGCQCWDSLGFVNVDSGGTITTYHTITAVDSSTDTFTVADTAAAGITEYKEIRFGVTGGATLPGGVASTSARYRARNVTATTFQIATDPVVPIVNLTSNGTWTPGQLTVGVNDLDKLGTVLIANNRCRNVDRAVYAENGGQITVRGLECHNDTVNDNQQIGGAVTLVNCDHAVIEGVNCFNRPTAAVGQRGIFVTGLNPRVTDCHLEGIGEEGLHLTGCRNVWVDGVTVRDCGPETNIAAFVKNVHGGVIKNIRLFNPSTLVRYGFLVDSGSSNCKNLRIDEIDADGSATAVASTEADAALRAAAQDPSISWGRVTLRTGRVVYGAHAQTTFTATPAAGATGTITVNNVYGARVGDDVRVRFGSAMGALQYRAEVTADNTVTVYWHNPTTGSLGPYSAVTVTVFAERATQRTVTT